MSQNTTNTTAFIEAQQYSKFIIENLHDELLPDTFTRDVTDFGEGTTLNIKSVGTVSIQDVAEDVPLTFNAIDTSTVTLTITDYTGDAWFVNDDLREDGSQIETLSALRAQEAVRALQEDVETKFLAACNDAQTADGTNTVNGVDHRLTANGTSRAVEVADFAYMRYGFDKSNNPQTGRIAIVDPSVALTMDTLTNLVNVSNNPHFEGMITEGFRRGHQFVKNIYGWDIYVSNRLDILTAATTAVEDRDGNVTNAAAADVANVFMCVADDNCRPIMRAWRRMPKTEGWRDHDNRQDKFQVTTRYGFGAQRIDSLGILLSNPATY